MTAPVSWLSVSGTAMVVRFNWPKYVAAGVVLLVAIAASAHVVPVGLRLGLWLGAISGCLWSITSLVATWWIYDHRLVYERVNVGLGDVGTWVSVHAGFDDATPVLTRTVGSTPSSVVELAMPAGSSLRRARSLVRPATSIAPLDALPFASGSMDTIFVTFAAHEVRDRSEQRALFAELRRSLRPKGRLIVTEHARDLANFVVYGPGALHFQRRSVWHQRAEGAGLALGEDTTITPFVHRLTWHA